MKTTWIGLAGLLMMAAGCDLYAPHHRECHEICLDSPQGSLLERRDPYSGQCDYYGGSRTTCQQICNGTPVPQMEPLIPPDVTSWPVCESPCNGLDLGSCHQTPECQAAYLLGSTPTPEARYYDCWPVGPAPQPGECSQLDALACSQRDDCEKIHDAVGGFSDPAVLGTFLACRDEGDTPPPPPPAWGTCESRGPECFVMVGERPDCPAGTEPGVATCEYTGYCLPADLCDVGGEGNPGFCYGPDSTCDQLPPDCPDGTVAGTSINGCFSGFCIPADACEEPPPCDQLGTEAQCLSVDECIPYYQGDDCSCAGDTCSCEDYVFQSCA